MDRTTVRTAASDVRWRCACGCGQTVPLAPRTDRRYGWRKGEPLRFLNHHASRLRRRRACPRCGAEARRARSGTCWSCYVAGTREAAIERFWSKVNRSGGPDACWPWTGWIKDNGYGHAGAGHNQSTYAHRRAYALVIGPIPALAELDHTCHNADPSCVGGPTCQHRRCANPAHLEAVTHLVNVRRGRVPKASAT